MSSRFAPLEDARPPLARFHPGEPGAIVVWRRLRSLSILFCRIHAGRCQSARRHCIQSHHDFGAGDLGAMRTIGRDEGGFSRGEGERRAVDGEVDRAAEHDGDLFLGVAMNGEDRTRLVTVADEGLILAVNCLPCNAIERMFDGDGAPVDRCGWGPKRRVQNTNQPQKRASANRKKKTLETPPPKIR